VILPTSAAGIISRDLRRVALGPQRGVANGRLVGLRIDRRLVDRRRWKITPGMGRLLLAIAGGSHHFAHGGTFELSLTG
jgi:hypothetical protein